MDNGTVIIMDMIRPVFQRPRTVSAPIVKTKIDTQNGVTMTLDIRPESGQQWVVNYARIFCSASSAGAFVAYIYYVDGTNSVILAEDLSFNVGDSISVASFGNGPIVVTHDKYLQMSATPSGGSGTVHMIGLAESM